MRQHSTANITTLSPEEISSITKLVFHAPPPEPSDVLLVFGAPEGDWSAVAKSYQQGLAKTIIVSGGTHDRTHGQTEASLIKKYLYAQGVAEQDIIEDHAASNTLENVLNSKKIVEEYSLPARSILYHCLNFHSGRCYLTLLKHFPQSALSATTHNVLHSGLDITRDNWHLDQAKASRVLGEYERIITYSQKGDIAPPASILHTN